MHASLALLFAIGGTFLLALISFFISINRPWLAVVAGLFSLLFIGAGFIVKAKLRQKSSDVGPK